MISVGPKAKGATKGAKRVDLRSARRMRVIQPAKIVIDADVMLHCEVRDISTGGARIAIRGHVDLPETFELFICAHDLRVYPARLRWRDGDFAGVSFGLETPALAGPAPLLAPPPAESAPEFAPPRREPPVRPTEARAAAAVIQTGTRGRERRRPRGRRAWA